MSGILANLTEAIGHTPLLDATRFVRASKAPVCARILCKLESSNPSFSSKDRAAASIIRGALASGVLVEGGTVVEATSGNMGIALASVSAALGLKMVVFMPASMSAERRKLLAHLGAELHLVDGTMDDAVKQAKDYCAQHPQAYFTDQFANDLNAQAHYVTTGPEIWQDTKGDVAAFVAGVGSAGTLIGTGKFLLEQDERIRVVGVEPAESPLLSTGRAAAHGIQGIGANFVPAIYDPHVVSEVVCVETQAALQRAREFARFEGALVGISSGAALEAALTVASRPDMQGKTVVALLPDTAERYISTDLFNEC